MNWITRKLGIGKVKDRFAKDVLALSGSNLAVQALTLAVLPVTTRIYTPADFGVLAIFSAVVQTITSIATLRYEIPIPNSESNRTAFNLILVCAINAVMTTIITLLFFVLYQNSGFQIQSVSSLGWFVWLVPLGVLASSSFNVLQFYAIRERQYKMIARTRFNQSLIAIVVQVGFGLLLKGPLGLIVGFLLQSGVGGLRFVRHLVSNRAYEDKRVNTEEIRKSYAQHQEYFRYSTPEALSHMGALQLPLVIIGAYVNAAEAGLLFMANRIMQLPLSIVSSSFAHVFAGSTAKSFRDGSLNDLFISTVHRMLKYVVAPVFFLGILCWAFFPYVLGEEWKRAGEIAIWLSVSVSLQCISSGTGTSLYVSKNERLAFIIHLVGFVVRVFPTAFCAIYYPAQASYIYALSGALHYLIYFIAVSVICRTTKEQYFALFSIFRSIIFALVLFVLVLVAIGSNYHH
jgi:O-antigen/teichoic acid export membrane protein